MSQTVHVQWRDYVDSQQCVYVDFDVPLHHRGSDHTFYKNNWDVQADGIFSHRDSKLLQSVVRELLQDGIGVPHVRAENYLIQMTLISRAVTFGVIQQAIIKGIKRAGFRIHDEPKQPQVELIRIVSKPPLTYLKLQIVAFAHATWGYISRAWQRFDRWAHS